MYKTYSKYNSKYNSKYKSKGNSGYRINLQQRFESRKISH